NARNGFVDDARGPRLEHVGDRKVERAREAEGAMYRAPDDAVVAARNLLPDRDRARARKRRARAEEAAHEGPAEAHVGIPEGPVDAERRTHGRERTGRRGRVIGSAVP